MSPKPRPRAPVSKSASSFESAGKGQRLQKVLAAAGIASRRECEALILDGRVEVNRQTVTELGTRVDPSQQEIRVDGMPLAQSHHVYYLVNKPAGVVSTNRDPDRRTRVIDLVPGDTRLFTIGRLDRSSEGLIIVTNDGELANLLTHPRYGIPKTYRATVLGFPTPETLQKLRTGVHLAEGVAQVAQLRAKGRHARGAELEIVLTEGRNREIRRVLARVGHKVLHLRRVAIGPLRLGNLAAGETRRLTGAEVQQLRACVRQMMKQGGMRPESTAARGNTGRSAGDAGRHARTSRRPATGGQPAAKKTGGNRNRQDLAGAGKQPGSPRTGTKRPKTGVVLDYDRTPPVGAKRPPKKHPSGKRQRH
jgi:23S rRNA pseudouridine2605 synthase